MGQILTWFRKGFWTVLDQALYAGSNFVLNVLLIDALTENAYGAFAVAFSVFLFFGTIHTGIITEPMLVFGAGRFRSRFWSYVGILRKAHILFAVFSGIALALISFVVGRLGSPLVAEALLVLAVAQPFILFLWLMRRACYVLLRPQTSAFGGIIYMVLVLAAAYALQRTGSLTVTSALLVMSGTSLIGGLWILWRLRSNQSTGEDLTAAEAISEHRRYSGWATATGVLGWLPGNIPYIVLPLMVGTSAPGILKAIFNFMMPAAHAYAALSILLVPMFVRARESGRFRSFVFATAGLLIVANGLYWILLGVFGENLIQLLYKGKYVEYAGYLWFAGAYPFVSGLAVVVRTALRSLEKPNYVFWASVSSSITAATIGLLLIYYMGVVGAIIGFSLNMGVELAFMAYFFSVSSKAKDLQFVDDEEVGVAKTPSVVSTQ
ncbi:MAG: hypothetical protein KDD65_14730 [Bacteroidetes bacterium]|nr:hypothetical protein [Bacteroidota bacterium]